MNQPGGWSCKIEREEGMVGDRIHGRRGGIARLVKVEEEEEGQMHLGMRLRGRGGGKGGSRTLEGLLIRFIGRWRGSDGRE